jgi:hypothetical protein
MSRACKRQGDNKMYRKFRLEKCNERDHRKIEK